MLKTEQSHAFFVGSFEDILNPLKLDSKEWEHRTLSLEEYRRDCSTYYQSHVDAMAELRDGESTSQSRPKFLNSARHYCHSVNSRFTLSGTRYNIKTSETEFVLLNNYNLTVCNLHLYFFPYATFFAIEVDDSESEINDLTMAHFWLMGLSPYLSNSTKKAMTKTLSPIMKLIRVDDYTKLIANGNKLKLFQTIQIERKGEVINESDLLYEIATSSAIGVIGSNAHMSPSSEYVNDILNNNMVSAFKEWKGLSLVDSFTALSFEKSFNPWPFHNQYFPYIYLRCLFEKVFCFHRNNLFRQNSKKRNLSRELMNMEKFYFYDDISFNFLPNLIYQSVSKGLCINEEKKLLSKQIKEKSDTNKSLFLSMLSALAIFSVCNTIRDFLIKIFFHDECNDEIVTITLFSIAVFISIIIGVFLYSHKRV